MGKKYCISESSWEHGKRSAALSVKWQSLNCVQASFPLKDETCTGNYFFLAQQQQETAAILALWRKQQHTLINLQFSVSIPIQSSSDISSKDLNMFHNYQCFNRITWGTEVFPLLFCILRKSKHWWLKQGSTECWLQSWQWGLHPFTFPWCFTQQFKFPDLQENFAKTWC